MARAALVVALLLGGACGATRSSLTVESAGVSLTETQVSVGAVFTTAEPVRDVVVAIELRDAHGSTVAEVTDRLPWCAARCPWGSTYVGGDLGAGWRRVNRAVVRADGRAAASPATVPVGVHRGGDGDVVGQAPGAGVLHAILRTASGVAGGVHLLVMPGERFRIEPVLLPPLAGETLEAAFYDTGPHGGD